MSYPWLCHFIIADFQDSLSWFTSLIIFFAWKSLRTSSVQYFFAISFHNRPSAFLPVYLWSLPTILYQQPNHSVFCAGFHLCYSQFPISSFTLNLKLLVNRDTIHLFNYSVINFLTPSFLMCKVSFPESIYHIVNMNLDSLSNLGIVKCC